MPNFMVGTFFKAQARAFNADGVLPSLPSNVSLNWDFDEALVDIVETTRDTAYFEVTGVGTGEITLTAGQGGRMFTVSAGYNAVNEAGGTTDPEIQGISVVLDPVDEEDIPE